MSASAYVICTAPRSGSTLLCYLLQATGVAGHPGSHFHVPDIAAWRETYRLPPDAPIQDVLASGRAVGRGTRGPFALRLQHRSAPYFFEQIRSVVPEATSDAAAFDAVFGTSRWIWLRREDVVAQAVSFVKADQTGLWHQARDGSEIERLSPPAPPVYDRSAISARVAEFEDAQAKWRKWFAAQHVTPLEVTYCALNRDPLAVLEEVTGYLGLRHASDVEVPTAKLADELSAEWIARFKRGD